MRGATEEEGSATRLIATGAKRESARLTRFGLRVAAAGAAPPPPPDAFAIRASPSLMIFARRAADESLILMGNFLRTKQIRGEMDCKKEQPLVFHITRSVQWQKELALCSLCHSLWPTSPEGQKEMCTPWDLNPRRPKPITALT